MYSKYDDDDFISSWTRLLILLTMQKSNSEVMHRYAMPSGMATNSQELRTLQHKLLKNHYQPQQDAKLSIRSNRSLPQGNPEQLQMHSQISQYDQHSKQTEKQQKLSLAEDLAAQIRSKTQVQRSLKQQNRSQEDQLTKHLTKLDSLEKQRERQFNRKYAIQAQEDIKGKQDQRRYENRLQKDEKEFYKNRYSTGDLTQAAKKSDIMSNPTKQYAHELDRAIQDRDVKLVNPQQLSNSSFKITRRTDAISSLDFMTHGSEQRNAQSQLNSYFNEVRDKDSVQRMDLKSSLIAQMKEKQSLKKTEKKRDFAETYTNQEYMGKHHPINNPIDYRLAHDNRYLMKELGALQ